MTETSAESSINSRIAKRYRELLGTALSQPLDAPAAERQARAAAAALLQAGTLRHKLLLLGEIVDRFEAQRTAGDPASAIPKLLIELGGIDSLATIAERYYRLALALAPDFAEALYNLAVLRRRAGAHKEALRLFDRVAETAPHPRAMPHAHLAANAAWNVAALQKEMGKEDTAAEAYGRALAGLDNFGVRHLELARFLRGRGCLDEAASHYGRIMAYSHLYAAEFVEPDYAEDERPPPDRAGRPCDPLAATAIGEIPGAGQIVYWWHLYVLAPYDSGPASAETLARAWLSAPTRRPGLLRHWRRWRGSSSQFVAATSIDGLRRQSGRVL